MKNLKQQGISAFIWDFSGKLVNKGMGFVISIFLARLLAPEDFGLIALVMIVIGIIQVFGEAGLTGALIQRKHVLDIHYSSVFYFVLAINILFMMIMFSIASWFAEFYDNEILEIMLKVLSFSFLLSAFKIIYVTRFRKAMNYAVLSKTGVVASSLGGIVGILMAYFGAGVWSLVIATLIQGIFFTGYLHYKSDWRPSLSFSFKALKQLWAYGFRVFLASLLNNIFMRIDYMIIGKLYPITTLGFLQRAKSLNELGINLSAGSLMSILFPLLSKIKNDLKRFQNIIIKSLNVIMFLGCLLLGILYLNAENIIVLMFGEKWMPSVNYFKVIVLGSLVLPVGALLGNIIKSRGDSKAYLRLELYKKTLMSTEFLVLFYFGVMSFLYYRIVTSLGTIFMQIVFASKEIKLEKILLIIPVIIQIVIGVVSVVLVVLINKETELGYIYLFISQTLEYVVFFVVLNLIFRTKAYQYIIHELQPLYSKYKLKIGL